MIKHTPPGGFQPAERTNVWLDNRAGAAVKCTWGGHVCGRVRTLDRTGTLQRPLIYCCTLGNVLHTNKQIKHTHTLDANDTDTGWF